MKKIILLVAIFLVVSCKTNDKSSLLLGAWETSAFINQNQLEKAFKEEAEEGMRMEMTFNETHEFLQGGRFNNEGEITLRLGMGNQEIPLKFYVKESGTWELHESNIVQVTQDYKIVPMDETTKNVLANAPEFKQMIEPVKGEASSFEILSLSKTVMQLTSNQLPGITLTYNKK